MRISKPSNNHFLRIISLVFRVNLSKAQLRQLCRKFKFLVLNLKVLKFILSITRLFLPDPIFKCQLEQVLCLIKTEMIMPERLVQDYKKICRMPRMGFNKCQANSCKPNRINLRKKKQSSTQLTFWLRLFIGCLPTSKMKSTWFSEANKSLMDLLWQSLTRRPSKLKRKLNSSCIKWN